MGQGLFCVIQNARKRPLPALLTYRRFALALPGDGTARLLLDGAAASTRARREPEGIRYAIRLAEA